jgi:F-type H+-transporting ATPase subunit delta
VEFSVVSSSLSGLSGRYAWALYAQADETLALDAAVEQMARLGHLIDSSSDLRTLLNTPLLDIQQSRKAILAVLDAQKISGPVRSLVGVVADHRRLASLRAIVEAFAHLVASRRGVQLVSVTSAHPLSEIQRRQLRARLTEMGYPSVNLQEQVDPSLLGGLRLHIGAQLYDTSLKTQLQRLQHAMKGAA